MSPADPPLPGCPWRPPLHINRHLEVDVRLAVEDANKRFYDAFASGSVQVSGGSTVLYAPGCALCWRAPSFISGGLKVIEAAR